MIELDQWENTDAHKLFFIRVLSRKKKRFLLVNCPGIEYYDLQIFSAFMHRNELPTISLFQDNLVVISPFKDTWYLSPENDCERYFHAVFVLQFNTASNRPSCSLLFFSWRYHVSLKALYLRKKTLFSSENKFQLIFASYRDDSLQSWEILVLFMFYK